MRQKRATAIATAIGTAWARDLQTEWMRSVCRDTLLRIGHEGD